MDMRMPASPRRSELAKQALGNKPSKALRTKIGAMDLAELLAHMKHKVEPLGIPIGKPEDVRTNSPRRSELEKMAIGGSKDKKKSKEAGAMNKDALMKELMPKLEPIVTEAG